MKKNNLKIPNQAKVWDNIASEWNTYRIKPIKEAVDFIKNCKGKVLDIGCGSGRNFVNILGDFYAVDFSKNQIKCAKKKITEKKMNIKTKVAKAEKLPFKDNFFDKIMSIATIHCIDSNKKREKALSEMYRVLKKDGIALITVWDKDQDKFRKENKEIFLSWDVKGKKFKRYYYLYNKKEIIELLKKIGFKIIKILDKTNKKSNSSDYANKNIIIYIKK